MILAYHEFSERDLPYAYNISRLRFDDHLSMLTAGHASAEITFDDGHLSQFQHALPALQAHAIGATFFLVPGWIESRPGYMSWAQAKEVARCGYTIQSHSWSHPFLARSNAADLRQELERSKAVLEDRIGAAVDEISAPGGSWSQRVVAACAAAGYRRLYISDPWFGERRMEGIAVTGRLMVRGDVSAARLRRLIDAEARPWSCLRLPHRLRQSIRRAIGDSLYHDLWRLVANERSRQ